MDTKKPYLSKTLWVNFLIALFAIVSPGVALYISNNPVTVTLAVTIVNSVLRLVTKSGIQINDDNADSAPKLA